MIAHHDTPAVWAWLCVVAFIVGIIVVAMWMLSTGDPIGQGPPPPTTVLELPIG